MAKESMKAREVKRAKLAKRYQHKRDEIAAKVKSGEMDHEEAWIALSKLPRNSNPIRQHNRCKLTGRPKGYIRQFGISRIQFREMASNGLIPGVRRRAGSVLACLDRRCGGIPCPQRPGMEAVRFSGQVARKRIPPAEDAPKGASEAGTLRDSSTEGVMPVVVRGRYARCACAGSRLRTDFRSGNYERGESYTGAEPK